MLGVANEQGADDIPFFEVHAGKIIIRYWTQSPDQVAFFLVGIPWRHAGSRRATETAFSQTQKIRMKIHTPEMYQAQ